MRSALAEVLVGLPHREAIDRLPTSVTADGVTVEREGRRARWFAGGRSGRARYEVRPTAPASCSLTLALDGLDLAAAYHLVLVARRQLLDAARPATLPA